MRSVGHVCVQRTGVNMASQGDDNKVVCNANVNNDQEKNFITVYKRFEWILNNKHETFIKKTESLVDVWRNLAQCKFDSSDLQYIVQVIDWAKLHTLNIVLTGEWKKFKDEYQEPLLREVKATQNQLTRINSAFYTRCQKLLDVINNPWSDPTLDHLITTPNAEIGSKEIEFFCVETAYLTSVRLKKLCESQCEDLALNLVKAFMKCYRMSQTENFNLNATETQVWFIFDMYIALLYKFKENSSLLEMLKGLSAEEGLNLIRRFAKKRVKISKIWKHCHRIAILASQLYISSTILKPIEEVGDILKELIKAYISLNNTEDFLKEVSNSIRSIIRLADTAAHIYTFCEVFQEQFETRMKSFIIELYIRALTTDMNLLERQKSDNEKDKMLETTKRLAGGFTNLADVLKCDVNVSRECIMTAFSLQPTLDRMKKIEELAKLSGLQVLDTGQIWKCKLHPPVLPSDDLAWICNSCGDYMCKPQLNVPLNTNIALNEALTEEKLGITQELCDDLVVLLSSPRYQVFSWLLDWPNLHRLCVMYLNDPERTKNMVTELKFLDIDYSIFASIKKEPLDEYAGIERGYEHYLDQEFNYDDDQISNTSEDTGSQESKFCSISSDSTSEMQLLSILPRKSDPNTLKSLRMFRPSLKRSRSNSETSVPEKVLKSNGIDFAIPSSSKYDTTHLPPSSYETIPIKQTDIRYVPPSGKGNEVFSSAMNERIPLLPNSLLADRNTENNTSLQQNDFTESLGPVCSEIIRSYNSGIGNNSNRSLSSDKNYLGLLMDWDSNLNSSAPSYEDSATKSTEPLLNIRQPTKTCTNRSDYNHHFDSTYYKTYPAKSPLATNGIPLATPSTVDNLYKPSYMDSYPKNGQVATLQEVGGQVAVESSMSNHSMDLNLIHGNPNNPIPEFLMKKAECKEIQQTDLGKFQEPLPVCIKQELATVEAAAATSNDIHYPDKYSIESTIGDNVVKKNDIFTFDSEMTVKNSTNERILNQHDTSPPRNTFPTTLRLIDLAKLLEVPLEKSKVDEEKRTSDGSEMFRNKHVFPNKEEDEKHYLGSAVTKFGFKTSASNEVPNLFEDLQPFELEEEISQQHDSAEVIDVTESKWDTEHLKCYRKKTKLEEKGEFNDKLKSVVNFPSCDDKSVISIEDTNAGYADTLLNCEAEYDSFLGTNPLLQNVLNLIDTFQKKVEISNPCHSESFVSEECFYNNQPGPSNNKHKRKSLKFKGIQYIDKKRRRKTFPNREAKYESYPDTGSDSQIEPDSDDQYNRCYIELYRNNLLYDATKGVCKSIDQYLKNSNENFSTPKQVKKIKNSHRRKKKKSKTDHTSNKTAVDVDNSIEPKSDLSIKDIRVILIRLPDALIEKYTRYSDEVRESSIQLCTEDDSVRNESANKKSGANKENSSLKNKTCQKIENSTKTLRNFPKRVKENRIDSDKHTRFGERRKSRKVDPFHCADDIHFERDKNSNLRDYTRFPSSRVENHSANSENVKTLPEPRGRENLKNCNNQPSNVDSRQSCNNNEYPKGDQCSINNDDFQVNEWEKTKSTKYDSSNISNQPDLFLFGEAMEDYKSWCSDTPSTINGTKEKPYGSTENSEDTTGKNDPQEKKSDRVSAGYNENFVKNECLSDVSNTENEDNIQKNEYSSQSIVPESDVCSEIYRSPYKEDYFLSTEHDELVGDGNVEDLGIQTSKITSKTHCNSGNVGLRNPDDDDSKIPYRKDPEVGDNENRRGEDRDANKISNQTKENGSTEIKDAKVVLERLSANNNSYVRSVLANVPGLHDTELIRPANTNLVVNVVQLAGGRSNASGPVGNAQASTQVTPHIQRIGQPRTDKPQNDQTENAEPIVTTTPISIGSNVKPTTSQPSTLINILSQQVIRPGQSNCLRTRPTPLINIVSHQIIRPSTQTVPKMITSSAQTNEQVLPKVDTSEPSTSTAISTAKNVTATVKSAGATSTSAPGTILQFICKSATLPKFQQAFGKTVYQTNSTETVEVANAAENSNTPFDANKKTQVKSNPTVNIQPIQGSVIYTRHVPVGQAINLIPPGRQVFRIATSNPDQISLVKDSVIHSKMSALLTAALQGKKSSDAQSEGDGNNETVEKVTVTRPTLVQNSRIVKPVIQIPSNVIRANTATQSNLSSTTLEQLREFDMVYKQIKERSNTSTTPSESSTQSEPESSPRGISVTYLNQGQKFTQLSPVVVVSSYCNLQPAASPALSVTSQGSSSPCVTPAPTPTLPKVSSKTSSKGKSLKNASSHASKASPIPKPQQKPQEDEHTTQRIFDILAEYAEQLRNSPDLNNKPAPRRRSNPPTNPNHNSKRKKNSSSKKPNVTGSGISESDIEDQRTIESEDSSCGVMQLSVKDDEQPQTQTTESNDSTTSSRPLLLTETNTNSTTRNLIIADSSVGEALKLQNTAVLVPGNYIMPVSMVKGGQQIAVVSGGSKILATVPARTGPNMLLFQSFLNQNRKTGVPTVKYSTLQPISGIASQNSVGVSQSPVILPQNTHNLSAVTLGQSLTLKKMKDPDNRGNTELLLAIAQPRDSANTIETNSQPDSSTIVQNSNNSKSENNLSHTNSPAEKLYNYQKSIIATPIATPVISQASISKNGSEDISSTPTQSSIITFNIGSENNKEGASKTAKRVQSVLVTACTSNGPMLSHTTPRYRKPSEANHINNETNIKGGYLHNGEKQKDETKHFQTATVYFPNKSKKVIANPARLDKELHQLCLQRKQAALERELRLQKSLLEECEDLGVDEPSTSDLFPEADLLFDANHSPSFDQASQDIGKKISHQDIKDKSVTLFSDDDNSSSLRTDFLFESVQYQTDGELQYQQSRQLTNGQGSTSNESASSCEDSTLLRSCASMSDVTLNSPISLEFTDNPTHMNKYKFKYSNRKKVERHKQTGTWATGGEVSSSEDTMCGELAHSPKQCVIKRESHSSSCDEDEEFRVVRVAISKTDLAKDEESCEESHYEDDLDSPSGRGARRSVKKTCSCCNGAEEGNRKRPPSRPHTPALHKKAFLNKKR